MSSDIGTHTAGVASERELVGLARELGAAGVGSPSPAEKALLRTAARVPDSLVERFRDAIARGDDPLGDVFCRLRTPRVRRPAGATYTPRVIVMAMTAWSRRHSPARVVDPGSGSGRFVVAAGRAFASAELWAIESDPLAALLTRAHLGSAGLGERARVLVSDYRALVLPPVGGRTLFVGNPPYVRHHAIERRWKSWLVERAASLELRASRLAGLHVHFALATALLGRTGDYGTFVTAAEWLDVNYGSLLRALFLGPLGGQAVHVIDATAAPFADADTTAAIVCFELGAPLRTLRMRSVRSPAELAPLDGGKAVRRERAQAAPRWTSLFAPAPKRPAGFVELGELCRVHRGQVTGSNRVWIAGSHSRMLPEPLLFATVTRARELFAAAPALADAGELRSVIDLPVDLDELPAEIRRQVERFLRVARALGADRGFVARHRKAWWAVGLHAPAPILATYMARRPPAFVRNPAHARHINIAHGLYPRERLSESVLDALALYLSGSTRLSQGRTYAGGLTKFEPKEMERLAVPMPEALLDELASRREPGRGADMSNWC